MPRSSSPKTSPEALKSQKVDRQSLWLDTWLFEYIALAFSIACFIAMCGVLRAYDNQRRPELTYHLSLNAIISILATGCKSSLIFVIGEAIAQLTWLWFRGATYRTCFGLQAFDSASRGPLGSMMIMFHHRGRSLVSIGAAATVLLLLFEPFAQQVLRYPTRQAVAANNTDQAFAPQTQQWMHNSSYLDFESAFTMSIWSSDFTTPPSCASGNCTWKTFSSVGICSRCADMTDIARLNCSLPPLGRDFNQTCEVSLPYGYTSRTNASFSMD